MRPGLLKLIWRIVKLTLILFFGLSILWVIVYRFVDPPVTWLMVSRGFERKSDGKDWKIDKKWIDFDDIADPMKKAAVAAEDQKFLDHFGFDFKAMERAIDKNAHSRCALFYTAHAAMPRDGRQILRFEYAELVRIFSTPRTAAA